MNPSPIFSNQFENNYIFMHLLTNWNNYLRMMDEGVENPELMKEWRNELMRDWYNGAKKWLNNNKDDKYWRSDIR